MDRMSLTELRSELKKYGAKLAGRKKDLIERLSFYRENDCKITGQSDTDVEYKMDLPSYSEFKDIHAGMQMDMPPLKTERIFEYMALFSKLWDDKCKQLYEERFIRYARVNRDRIPNVYFTGCIWAEMKKNISYKVDLWVESSGVVLEAQCECGAGQGPTAHCKHVLTLLYGLVQFCLNGKMLTEESCTQVLQTFHKPKAFKGSPMKCETLQKVRGQKSIDYDPRPRKYQRLSGKMDRIKNICLNHQFTNMPVMQLFTPANPVALTLDHSYCPGLNTDVFLKNEKISFITAEDVAEIEQRTRGQSASLKWQEEHQKRITTSNFGKICKAKTMDMDKFARSLMHQRTLHTPPILHGKKYERLAEEKFELQTGLKTSNCGLYISEEYPFLAASPDAIINNRSIPVEVKCPYLSRSKTIDSITVPYLVNDKGLLTLDSKHDYYYQVQGQIMCTGADFATSLFIPLRT